MTSEIIRGIFLPFFGTSLGACCVFGLKRLRSPSLYKLLNATAAGVMTAASFFSLILPAIEQSEKLGRFSFLPAAVGMIHGGLLLWGFEKLHERFRKNTVEEARGSARTALLVFAIVLHNVPEGMAVGAVLAARLFGDGSVTEAAALALAAGIAIQNVPEGAILSMPLAVGGKSRFFAFTSGVLSGVVEPIAAVLTILAAELVVPLLPYFLGFAAGAMLYVSAGELIPAFETDQNRREIAAFLFGFLLMMMLDVMGR